jgi:hypothetical protein
MNKKANKVEPAQPVALTPEKEVSTIVEKKSHNARRKNKKKLQLKETTLVKFAEETVSPLELTKQIDEFRASVVVKESKIKSLFRKFIAWLNK